MFQKILNSLMKITEDLLTRLLSFSTYHILILYGYTIIIFFQKLKQVTFKWNMLMALVLINSNRMDGEKIGMLYFQR